jgi:microcystin degradation protein MlrC
MKAVVAQFIFESNTFNPVPAEQELFTRGGTWLTDEAALRAWSVKAPSQLSGSLAVLEPAGWTTAPVFAAMCGSPAGRLSRACFAAIRRELAERLRAALPAEAMVLHLHGAASAIGEDDVEGNLLAMVREELGHRGLLVLSLDLHANVTRRMLTHADAVTAYRTMPHCDFVATGERAAVETMLDRLTAMLGPQVRAAFRGASVNGWATDPFSMGCYSHALPGQASARAKLAQPVGERIWFAGEATAAGDGDFGAAMTAGGAFLAGEAAVRAVRL